MCRLTKPCRLVWNDEGKIIKLEEDCRGETRTGQNAMEADTTEPLLAKVAELGLEEMEDSNGLLQG